MFEGEEGEQEAQGLKTFVFSVITVNDEHTKPRFKSGDMCRIVFKVLV